MDLKFEQYSGFFNTESDADYSDARAEQMSDDITFSFDNSNDLSMNNVKAALHSCSDALTDDVDQVPFNGNMPNLNVLAEMVRSQIDDKGVEFVVEKCLDLDLELEEEPQPLMRKMVRKSPRQIRELRRAFRSTPEWSRNFEEKLATSLGLTRAQVHKWHFDEKKRNSKKQA